MTKTLQQTLVPRVHLLLVALILATAIGLGVRSHEAQAQGGSAVNVAAAVLYIECPSATGSWHRDSRVLFSYMQLNGERVAREATVANGRLVFTDDGTPAVVFEQLSINWWDFATVYRFISPQGEYLDHYIRAGNWNRSSRYNAIYHTVFC
jgi:hypothetical protein